MSDQHQYADISEGLRVRLEQRFRWHPFREWGCPEAKPQPPVPNACGDCGRHQDEHPIAWLVMDGYEGGELWRTLGLAGDPPDSDGGDGPQDRGPPAWCKNVERLGGGVIVSERRSWADVRAERMDSPEAKAFLGGESTERGWLDTARVGETTRAYNKLYIKTLTGEVQIGLISGSVVVWHNGLMTVVVSPGDGSGM